MNPQTLWKVQTRKNSIESFNKMAHKRVLKFSVTHSTLLFWYNVDQTLSLTQEILQWTGEKTSFSHSLYLDVQGKHKQIQINTGISYGKE
jgi:hypothetical protein